MNIGEFRMSQRENVQSDPDDVRSIWQSPSVLQGILLQTNAPKVELKPMKIKQKWEFDFAAAAPF